MENQEPQSTVVMGHIADIKEKLAVNTTQTNNVANLLEEIKKDVKSLPSVFVGRPEFDARLKELDIKITANEKSNTDHEQRMRRIEMWGAILIGLAYALQFYFNFLK